MQSLGKYSPQRVRGRQGSRDAPCGPPLRVKPWSGATVAPLIRAPVRPGRCRHAVSCASSGGYSLPPLGRSGPGPSCRSAWSPLHRRLRLLVPAGGPAGDRRALGDHREVPHPCRPEGEGPRRGFGLLAFFSGAGRGLIAAEA